MTMPTVQMAVMPGDVAATGSVREVTDTEAKRLIKAGHARLVTTPDAEVSEQGSSEPDGSEPPVDQPDETRPQTTAQLKAHAAALGVDIPAGATKADIQALISIAEAPAAEPGE